MLDKFIKHLKDGGLIIYPTETAYALGCDAANQKAVDLIFKIKKRPKKATLPLIADSLAMVKRYCQMTADEKRLAKKYWPGALTLVLKVKRGVGLAGGIIKRDGTVAVRVSAAEIARKLSRDLDAPIVSTSANLRGMGECYSAALASAALKDKSILIIDGGRLKKRKPSTIARVDKGRVTMLRPGGIKL